ncbi:MAG: hypothetical protein J6U54_12490 [Clostridiales bacterium]|nr:hypothetical protein [Clostridiales bacterium]
MVNLYIDPATTSYIIQIAAAVIVALGAFVGIFWNKLKRLFKKKGSEEEVKIDDKIKAKDNDEDVVIKAEDLLDD